MGTAAVCRLRLRLDRHFLRSCLRSEGRRRFPEQQRNIQELIDRQKQWENPDITDNVEDRSGDYADLSSWVKRNLPAGRVSVSTAGGTGRGSTSSA